MPPTRRVDRPVSGAQQCAQCCLPTSRHSCCLSPTDVFSPSSARGPHQRQPEAPIIPQLRRLFRPPHMPRFPCRRPHGGSPLHLSDRSSPGGYVGGTPPSSSISGRTLAVCRSAPTADRLWFLPSLTYITTVSPLLFGTPERNLFTSFHPWSGDQSPPPLNNNITLVHPIHGCNKERLCCTNSYKNVAANTVVEKWEKIVEKLSCYKTNLSHID